jgi:hypothetical protein
MGACVCAFFTWNVSFSTLKSITDFFAAFPFQWNSIPQAISRSAKKCKNVFFWNIIIKWKLRWIRHIFTAKGFWVKVEKHHFLFLFYVRGFFKWKQEGSFFWWWNKLWKLLLLFFHSNGRGRSWRCTLAKEDKNRLVISRLQIAITYKWLFTYLLKSKRVIINFVSRFVCSNKKNGFAPHSNY